MNQEYLDTVWRLHRKKGKWPFIWHERLKWFYLPSLMFAFGFLAAKHAESFAHGVQLAVLFFTAGGGVSLVMGHLEWEAREEQFRKMEK